MKQKLIIIGPDNLMESLCLFEALSLIPVEDLYYQTSIIINQELQSKLNSIALQEGINLIFLSIEDMHIIKQQGKFPKSIQSGLQSNYQPHVESDILVNLSLNPTFFEIFRKLETKNKFGLRPSSTNKITMQTKWENLLFAKYYSYIPFSFTEIFYQIIKDSFKKSYPNSKTLTEVFAGHGSISKKIYELKIKDILIDSTSTLMPLDKIKDSLKNISINHRVIKSASAYLFSSQDKIPEQTLVITDNYINAKLFQMQGHRVVCFYAKLNDFYNFACFSQNSLNIFIPQGETNFFDHFPIEQLLNERDKNIFIETHLTQGVLISRKDQEIFATYGQELVETEQVLLTIHKVFWDFFLSNYTQPKKIFFSSQAICHEIKKHIRDIKLIQVSIIEFMNYCLHEQNNKMAKQEIFIREINRHEEVIKLCAKNAHPFVQGLYQFNRAQMSNKNFDRPTLVVEFLILNYRELYSCYEAIEELLNLSLESHLSSTDNQTA